MKIGSELSNMNMPTSVGSKSRPDQLVIDKSSDKKSEDFASVLDRDANSSVAPKSNRPQPNSKSNIKDSQKSEVKTKSEAIAKDDSRPQIKTKSSVEVSKTKESSGEDQNESKISLKQKSVVDFMQTLQSEFGISPEKVVSAFAKLGEEKLAAPPDAVATDFVANLGAEVSQLPKLKRLYNELVKVTGQADLDQKLSETSNVTMQVLSPKDVQLEKLQKSLEDLNKSFFDQPPSKLDSKLANGAKSSNKAMCAMAMMAPVAAGAAVTKGADASSGAVAATGTKVSSAASAANASAKTVAKETVANSPNASSALDEMLSKLQKSAGPANTNTILDQKVLSAMKGQAGLLGPSADISMTKQAPNLTGTGGMATPVPNLQPALATTAAMAGASMMPLAMQAPQSSSAGVVSDFELESTDEITSITDANLPTKKGLEEVSTTDFLKQSEMPVRSFNNIDKLQGYKKLSAKATDEAKSISKGSASADPTLTAGSNSAQTDISSLGPIDGKPAATGFAMNAQPSAEQRMQNAQNIVNQAQALSKKGGGEVTMQLQPEGLGKIKLKVSMQDGQVHVKMFADNDGAKKALERGLDDLKSNLASQKLHVESLKVEMAQDTSKSRLEQDFNQGNREQSHQMASEFMSQFRDDRQAFREGFNLAGGFKRFDQERNQPGVQPDPVEESSAPVRSRRATSRSLDLVA